MVGVKNRVKNLSKHASVSILQLITELLCEMQVAIPGSVHISAGRNLGGSPVPSPCIAGYRHMAAPA